MIPHKMRFQSSIDCRVFPGTLAVLVLRPVDADTFTVMCTTEVVVDTLGLNKLLPSKVCAARTGDVIGWAHAVPGIAMFSDCTSVQQPGCSLVRWATGALAATGANMDFSLEGNRVYSLRAILGCYL